MLVADRKSLAELIQRWQRGEVTAWQLVTEAEEAEDALLGDMVEVPEIPKSDPRSIEVAVLEFLAPASQQRVVPADIPAFLQFLSTRPGQELEAWAEFDSYWDAVDFEARESEATELYFGAGSSGNHGAA